MAESGNSALQNILKQRTEDADVKRFACELMKQTNSFTYTRNFFEESKRKVDTQIHASARGSDDITSSCAPSAHRSAHARTRARTHTRTHTHTDRQTDKQTHTHYHAHSQVMTRIQDLGGNKMLEMLVDEIAKLLPDV